MRPPQLDWHLGKSLSPQLKQESIHPRAEKKPPGSGSQKVATGSCLTYRKPLDQVTTHLPCSNLYKHSSQPSTHLDRLVSPA